MDATLLRKLAAEIVANRNGKPVENTGSDGPSASLLIDGEPPASPSTPSESIVTIRADKVVLQVQNLTIIVNPEVKLNPTINLEPVINVSPAEVIVNVPEQEHQIVVNVPEQGAPVVNLPELRPIIQVRPAAPAIAKEVKFQLNDDGVPVAATVSEVQR